MTRATPTVVVTDAKGISIRQFTSESGFNFLVIEVLDENGYHVSSTHITGLPGDVMAKLVAAATPPSEPESV